MPLQIEFAPCNIIVVRLAQDGMKRGQIGCNARLVPPPESKTAHGFHCARHNESHAQLLSALNAKKDFR
jgi:hypothetical protein